MNLWRIWRACYRAVWKLCLGVMSALRHGPAHHKGAAVMAPRVLASTGHSIFAWVSRPSHLLVVLSGLIIVRAVRQWRR